MRLFLLIGQSNMAGRGPLEGPDFNAEPEKNIYKLDDNGVWLKAKEPVHNDKPALVGVGPGLTFARIVLGALNGETAGLIPCAVGGTKIERWVPGGDLYERAVIRARLAMESGQLSGILWAQGESDSEQEADASAYKDRLFKLITSLREELNAQDVPFISAKLGGFIRPEEYPYTDQINRVLESAATVFDKFFLAESDGLTHKGDYLHYDAASAKELGRRMAEGWLTFQ
ncbi:sialate O-acetylesterase [Paenibacillus sp. FSL R7-0331]|uniref:sialate O-acetylesterase n=1 Tax=Paenibacillus sp. FSL R7-0331 TaxID=1536773 RepID=UPI0005AA486A|nr:sialate O-acetylesterase [Paenibacillus sp. FSL R7-0331]